MSSRLTVAGKHCCGEYDQPVEICCPTCGQHLTGTDVMYLDELVDWANQHTCPKTWSVN